MKKELTINTADIFTVVVNHEKQYSIWPVDKEVPEGWDTAKMKGTKEACLKYINEVWIDMRPLSLRKKMDGKKTGNVKR